MRGAYTKRKVQTAALIFLLALLCLAHAANAASGGKLKVRWAERDGYIYAYNAATGELVTNRSVGRYYVDRKGRRVTNAFRKGVYYDADGKKTKFTGGFIRADGNLYYFRNRKKVHGFVKIGKYSYYFGKDGAAVTGPVKVKGRWRLFKANGRMVTKNRWARSDGRKYYLNKRAVIKEGFFKKDGKTYYQTADRGVWTGLCEIEGKKYVFDQGGALNSALTARARVQAHPVNLGKSSDLLFFTRFESGASSYAQTGGDKGRAYGKYQFDYRYSLAGLISYCYKKDPVLFAEFRVFTYLKRGDKRLIKGNTKEIKEAGLDAAAAKTQSWDLAVAWSAVYKRNAAAFAALQDEYARMNYYDPVEKVLAARGIHLGTRTYVERGAVYSYAIQEGTSAAVNAVVSAGLADSVSSRDFLTRLYDYRWQDTAGWNRKTVFQYRYTNEKAAALSILAGLGG